MTKVIGICFKEGGKVYDFGFDPEKFSDLKLGEAVIVDTVNGPEYGLVAFEKHEILEHELAAPLKQILRRATPQDEAIIAKNRQREKEAFAFCQECIERREIEMNLVSVECNFDGSKLLFYFTHDGRLDFRELVKDLAARFHTRIELRQIGVRDEAKMIGGLGTCGRSFCCSSCMKDFATVSMKMAKDQGLSLNPTKISGACGRLMCCLKYEDEAYKELLRIVPGVGAVVETEEGIGTVVSVSLLHKKIKVKHDNMGEGAAREYNAETVRVVKPAKTGRRQEYYTPEQESTNTPESEEET